MKTTDITNLHIKENVLMQGKTVQVKTLNAFMMLQTITACTIGPLVLLVPEGQLDDKMVLTLIAAA
jgi:hypothetical protein